MSDTAMTPIEAERFARIERQAQYGVTIKDLFFLLRLVEKLDRLAKKQLPVASSQLPVQPTSAQPSAVSRQPNPSPQRHRGAEKGKKRI